MSSLISKLIEYRAIILVIIAFILFCITLSFSVVFLVGTYWDNGEYTQKNCTVTKLRIIATACCEIENCRCQECREDFSCDFKLKNRTEGDCCSSGKCCQETCNSRCSGHIESHRDWCKKVCTCIVRVKNQTCSSVCRTCFTITAFFSFPVGKGINVRTGNATKTLDCPKDDFECVNEIREEFPVKSTTDCLVKPTGKGFDLRLSQIEYKLWAILVVSLCGAAMVAIGIYLLVIGAFTD